MKHFFRNAILALVFLMGLSLPAFGQDTANKTFTLVVNPGTLVFGSTTLANGQVGLAYTGVCASVSGGIQPYTYSVVPGSGSLPAGITFGSNGCFGGQPSTAGSSTFTVQATDSETPPVTQTQIYTITVVNVLTITTASIPNTSVGLTYSATFNWVGGVGPYTVKILSGTVPTGYALGAVTGTSVTFGGTTTQSGTFTFILQVTDSATGTPAVVKATITATVKP